MEPPVPDPTSLQGAHKKALHGKKSIAKYTKAQIQKFRSEEDNDPLTDDGASAVSVPAPSRLPNTSAKLNSTSKGFLSDSDGVDSPTYDWRHRIQYHSRSQISFPRPRYPTTITPRPTSTLNTPDYPCFFTSCVFISSPSVPRVPEEPTVPALTKEDIQAFVQKAIEWKPPVDRPVRVYADGVYDLFHFGHALQLRQAKLAFPSVHLLVGVCSDELVKAHKARSIMIHAERLEAARHCRWVDEVVPEAPWIIDQEFLDKYQIDYVAHDEDPYVAEGHEDVYSYVKSQGKFIPTRRTPGVSTSELLERIVSGYRRRDFDAKLVKMGHAELCAEGSDYDEMSSKSASRSMSPT
ncbi:cholinephosphate cytidylyltransferase [Armillaria mellea]|nr:cholinephosphate cytidylyltransferase [Armillaria mellea]